MKILAMLMQLELQHVVLEDFILLIFQLHRYLQNLHVFQIQILVEMVRDILMMFNVLFIMDQIQHMLEKKFVSVPMKQKFG